MGQNLQRRRYSNQNIFTSKIIVCIFGGGQKLAYLRSQVNIVKDPDTKDATVPQR